MHSDDLSLPLMRQESTGVQAPRWGRADERKVQPPGGPKSGPIWAPSLDPGSCLPGGESQWSQEVRWEVRVSETKHRRELFELMVWALAPKFGPYGRAFLVVSQIVFKGLERLSQ